MIEKSRRRLDDLSEGDLSSIPSYDHLDPQGRNGVPLINGMSKLDERTLAEEGQMIFEDPDGDIDMKDLDIDGDYVPHSGLHSRRRELGNEDDDLDQLPQSSYSSRVGSSSEQTIDSDLLMTY